MKPSKNILRIELLECRTFLDGTLEIGWGSGGISYIKPAEDAASIAPLSDGTIVVFSHRPHDDALYRLGTDGQIEIGYGAGATAVLSAAGFGIAAQSDNRVLEATAFGINLYSAGGVLEQTFEGPMLNSTANAAVIEAFARLPDNSFAIAGHNAASTWGGIEWFNADGTHRVSIDQSKTIMSIAGQADGKLVALINNSNGQVLERFNANGQLDSSFANDTVIPAPSDPDPQIHGVAQYSSVSIDGVNRIYVGGVMPYSMADYQGFIVVRYLGTGLLDSSYGTNGLARNWPFALTSRGTAFRVAPDGRMYIAATTWPNEDDTHFATWRLNADGTGDRTWGINGIAEVDVTINTIAVAYLRDLEFMPNGDVIVSGQGGQLDVGNNRPSLAAVVRQSGGPAPTGIGINNGIITIAGSPVADTIYVKTLADGRVRATENGSTRTFSNVRGVLIAADAGDDYIDLSALTDFHTGAFPVTVNGEAGNDVIIGSQGPDSIVGGDGNDRVAGLGGNDSLSGTGGSDHIDGGNGDDSIFGNGGRDYLQGENGNDSITGQNGNDVIYGGNGDDSLSGGIHGDDVIFGGPGIDSFAGGLGNDTFYSNDGIPETITAGPDPDTAYADKDDLLISIEVPILS